MATPVVLTDQAIESIAAAVFDKPDAWVVEAYSDFDMPPRQFTSPAELAQYAKERLSKSRGLAFFFVIYPDMGGRAVRQTIQLKPGSVPGHKLRYTWEGWGLISILLERGDHPNSSSHVAANSERRAAKWESTYPKWDPPSTWNWKAVASHARRLQRVLSRVA
jgi:hypothetical protein